MRDGGRSCLLSFVNYCSTLKSRHLDEGHPWTGNLSHVGRWVTRSVLRGIGPARQSKAIPIDLVMKLYSVFDPLVPLGPTHPKEAFLLASIFLLRVVELSATRLMHLEINDKEATVTWLLTASKTGPQAHGVTRAWGCLCRHRVLPCPFHLAKVVISSVYKYASDNDVDDDARGSLPLFHDGRGLAPTKARVVATFEALALSCDLPLHSEEGLRLYGGHSARVTGSQELAKQGIEVSKIKMFARHSGDAILRSVAEAPLATLRNDLGLKAANPTLSERSGSYQAQVTDGFPYPPS